MNINECDMELKEEAQKAMKRLVEFFQNYKGEYFGLDDLGAIDLYINLSKL